MKNTEAKGKKRFIINIICAILTLTAYHSCYLSPLDYFWAGFWALSVPGWLVANLFFVLHWFLQKSWKGIVSTLVLALGYSFIVSTIRFQLGGEKKKNHHTFSVLSYNVKVFNVYNHLQGKDSINAKKLIQQVAEDSSDIKCLQEFFCEDSSKVFNTIAKIKEKGKYQYVISPQKSERHNYFGIAIFSKYPIVRSGEIKFAKSLNRGQFADIVVKKDTIRIYNIHLQSISLDEEKMFDSESYEQLKKNYNNIFLQILRGFRLRAKQTALVLAHIEKSPYPVIVCGDFNDTPYSYTYKRFREKLLNAFEEKGSGLDFSYNGKIFFLRIDNQFFSSKLNIHFFETDRSFNYSDHFPLRGIYSIKKPRL